MIVQMLKTYVAARVDDRDRLLAALGELGVVHLVPVDPAKARADEHTLNAIDHLGRACQVLSSIAPAGRKPDVDPLDAAEETLRIQREAAERRSRLASLHRQVEELAVWGEVRLGQFQHLADAGVEVKFYSVPADDVGAIRGGFVQPVGQAPGQRALVAVVVRGQLELPESAEEIPLPPRDRPSLRADAAEIDAALQSGAERLAELAGLVGDMQARRRQLQQEAAFTRAAGGGLAEQHLYAVQGWVPADRAEALASGLDEAGLAAAVRTQPPDEGDNPPTLIQYPRWAKPIKGLFDILGTLPGYEEYDLSPFFMIALPLFAAMLIGDAGYGLLFVLVPLLLYRKMLVVAGKAKTHLVLVIGVLTLLWGVLTANYFGITPETMAKAGGYCTQAGKGAVVYDYAGMSAGSGFYARSGNAMRAAGLLWLPEPDPAQQTAGGKPWNPRDLLIAVSFILGTLHLISAHLRKLVALLPDQRWVAEIGWCLILVAMLGVIWMLFFRGKAQASAIMPVSVMLILLCVGGALAVGFGSPARNPFKRIGLGLASSLLPLLGTFSDTMSYIRLMAVGLASYYIASAFNGLGAMLADSITWWAVVPVLIVLFGHALNIGLAMIAIFAHGVRLNMLEFSSNAGVQWAGYPFEPFRKQQIKES